MSSCRKVFAQGEDLWHLASRWSKQTATRSTDLMSCSRSCGTSVSTSQDHYVCAIGYPGLDEGCVWQVATPDALGQVSTLRRPQTIDINRLTWSGDVRGRHQRRAPALRAVPPRM